MWPYEIVVITPVFDLFTGVFADRKRSKAKYLILGSASPEIIRGASESLAGRVGFVNLSGFDLREIKKMNGRNFGSEVGFHVLF